MSKDQGYRRIVNVRNFKLSNKTIISDYATAKKQDYTERLPSNRKYKKPRCVMLLMIIGSNDLGNCECTPYTDQVL